jgi:hypothetical protein
VRDMHSTVAILRPLDIALDDVRGDITLDEGWSPYGQVTIVAEMPAPEDREAIDLRETPLRLDLRVQRHFGIPWSVADLTALGGGSTAGMTTLLDGGPASTITNRLYRPLNGSLVLPSQSRTFDLTVRSRTFDDVEGTLTITASTDEALLQDDVLLASAPLDPASTSLAVIVGSVLDRYDATLAADSEDATVAEVDATLWQPGVSAWAYLDALLEAASLRLWCDEHGVFRISARQATVEGSVVLSPSTMTRHRDTMTYDAEVWAGSVMIIYRWVDDLDLNRIEYDYAGTAAPTWVIERNDTIYPGPGAAAGALSRVEGRGRVLDVEADTNYNASPGMAATITPPDTIALTGYVSQVTWRLPDGEMSVQTRGLVDTPDTAYLFGPPGYSYLDVDPGVSYTEFDWSMA